jgi:plastocyanin
MSQQNTIRLRPETTEFLDTQSFNSGEIYFNKDSNTLNIMDGVVKGGYELLRADLSNATTGLGVEVSPTAPANARSGSLWLDTQSGVLLIYYNDGDSQQWIQPSSPSFSVGSSGSGSGSGTVNPGVSGAIAFYPSAGNTVDDNPSLIWNSNILNVTGTIQATGQKNRIRFHWDTLADLNSEVSPVDYHGMVAHAHDTGKLYYAHAGAWVAVASETSLPNSFSTITVAGQPNVVADNTTDTLTLVAGANVTITTNATTDTVTISASGGGSASNSFTTIAVSGQPNIIADSSIDTLTIVAGTGISLTTNATTDTLTISSSGSAGEANQNAFSNIAVAGQSTVVADSPTDTVTLVAGTGISITTNATTDTVTIASTGSNATTLTDLTDVNVAGVTDGQVLKYSTSQSKWIAAADLTATGGDGISLSDLSVSVVTASGGGSLAYNNTSGVFTFTPAVIGVTSVGGTGTVNGITLTGTVTSTGSLTLGGTLGNVSLTSQVTGTLPVLNGGTGTTTPSLVAGTNVTIAGTWPNQTINSTASGGVTTFDALTDNAGLTIDRIYLPAITMLSTTNNGSSSYRFDQYGTTDNPTVYAINGATIAFNLNVVGHPFLIQTSGGSNYNEGLTHVTTAGVVTTGSSAQGKTSGTLYWKIPSSISGNYRYICSIHGSMVGVITIKDIATI